MVKANAKTQAPDCRSACFGFVLVATLVACAHTTNAQLVGPTWQLVRFQGGDDKVLTPDDRSKYTLTFAADGRVSGRIDCNRATGAWKSSEKGRLEFGPMAVTRAMCPPGSLHDQIVKQLPFVRSYVIRDGKLFLSLMADGGIYEFEPAGAR
jgi:para-nitrobenzyl esterase